MKKIGILLLATVSLFLIAGCEKVESGNYKEGTYFGSAVDNYGGKENMATAVIYVNKDGMLKSITIDTTYDLESGGNTTKKTLGKDYNMKTYNPSAAGEWFEQIKKLEDKIIEKQGIDFLTLDAEGKTDAVSGCTIKLDAIYNAVQKALAQAR